MGELAKQLSKGVAESKGSAAPSVAESIALDEARDELAAALKEGSVTRIRAAWRKLDELED